MLQKSRVNVYSLYLVVFLTPIISYLIRAALFKGQLRLNCSNIFSSYISNDQIAYIGIAMLSVFLWLSYENIKDSLVVSFGTGLIIGGGLFNIFERLVTGCVMDYVKFFDLFWINTADVAITVGVLTVLGKVCIKPLMPKRY